MKELLKGIKIWEMTKNIHMKTQLQSLNLINSGYVTEAH